MSGAGVGGLPDAARATRANLVAHCTWLQARATGMRARVTPRLAMGDSGLPSDTFNVVCSARLDRRSAPAEIEAAITWYEGRPFSWWCAPGDEPADLPELLFAAGLEASEAATAMTADLTALAEAIPAPPGLVVERVSRGTDLRAFATLLAGLADPPDPLVTAFYEAGAAHLLRADCPLLLYVGRLEGHPVATAEVTITGAVAGLYNVSTVVGERRRGVGTAMTLLPLREARAAGARYGVLQAAPDGLGVYGRVGFAPRGRIAEFKPSAHPGNAP
jgi:hypothetical protein